MKNGIDIFDTSDYHINKRFYRQVEGPLSYLIKVVGIDSDSKKVCNPKTRICKDQGEKAPNEKYLNIVVMFFLLKTLRRRRVRNELKKKRHEELKQAV